MESAQHHGSRVEAPMNPWVNLSQALPALAVCRRPRNHASTHSHRGDAESCLGQLSKSRIRTGRGQAMNEIEPLGQRGAARPREGRLSNEISPAERTAIELIHFLSIRGIVWVHLISVRALRINNIQQEIRHHAGYEEWGSEGREFKSHRPDHCFFLNSPQKPSKSPINPRFSQLPLGHGVSSCVGVV